MTPTRPRLGGDERPLSPLTFVAEPAVLAVPAGRFGELVVTTVAGLRLATRPGRD